jgi:hypothetical protein
MHKSQFKTVLLAAAAAAALAACGSGDRDPTVTPGTPGTPGGPGTPVSSGVPQSAQGSVSGLLAYVNQLIDTMTNSTAEPVVLGDATLPTSDTTEPTP